MRKRSLRGRWIGRPRDDGALQVYLHVEAGSRLTGMSVNKFCNRYPLVQLKIDYRGRQKVERMNSATMRRTHARIKAHVRPPVDAPEIQAHSPMADAMERLVEQHLKMLQSRQ